MPPQRSGLLTGIALILAGLIGGLIVAAGLYQWEATTRAESLLADATPTMSVQISKEQNGKSSSSPGASASARPANTASGAGGGAEAGKAVYATNCNGCHPSGGAGVGPALKGLPADTIKQVTRQGRGTMPAFPSSRLSDQQLDDVVTFLK